MGKREIRAGAFLYKGSPNHLRGGCEEGGGRGGQVFTKKKKVEIAQKVLRPVVRVENGKITSTNIRGMVSSGPRNIREGHR